MSEEEKKAIKTFKELIRYTIEETDTKRIWIDEYDINNLLNPIVNLIEKLQKEIDKLNKNFNKKNIEAQKYFDLAMDLQQENNNLREQIMNILYKEDE